MIEKKFFVVSALRRDSSELGHLKRHDTENEAIKYAAFVIEQRKQNGNPYMDFYVLQVKARVGVTSPPLKIKRFK